MYNLHVLYSDLLTVEASIYSQLKTARQNAPCRFTCKIMKEIKARLEINHVQFSTPIKTRSVDKNTLHFTHRKVVDYGDCVIAHCVISDSIILQKLDTAFQNIF